MIKASVSNCHVIDESIKSEVSEGSDLIIVVYERPNYSLIALGAV